MQAPKMGASLQGFYWKRRRATLVAMHARAITFAAVAAVLLLPAIAAADVPHTVRPGESLSSVATTDGLSVAALAAANGLSLNAGLTVGQVLEIPPRTSATAETSATVAEPNEQATSTKTSPSHHVYVSDTPSDTSSHAAPQPTEERVSGSEIAEIADANGVPAALAEAIGWQESGWNNDEISSADAVGVMQIVPSTWSWIDSNLTPNDPLGTASASENVRAGVLLLHDLLAMTGDNYAETAAGYYQGLASVERYGMYPSTRQYVTDVIALEQRLAG
jgi:soluble lytic murein transglycosylase-like protein